MISYHTLLFPPKCAEVYKTILKVVQVCGNWSYALKYNMLDTSSVVSQTSDFLSSKFYSPYVTRDKNHFAQICGYICIRMNDISELITFKNFSWTYK